jgi:serine/threonine protein kinase
MTKLTKKLTFETTFGLYEMDEIIGEGGAGRVYGGIGPDNTAVALKLLTEERASSDKRRRFKNEVAFLTRNRHPNIVPVIDHGVERGQEAQGAFYVMPRYDGNLRDVMHETLSPEQNLARFGQILDGVEALHLLHVTHRALKPENILHIRANAGFALADFGVAQFTEDLLATRVETAATQSVANFQYAAPEQRAPGSPITAQADIYALGLMLNEMFTGSVPHGSQYRVIADVVAEFAFLDLLISRMLAQSPSERPRSIAEIKRVIQRYRAEAISMQRISAIDGTVIKADQIDEPLTEEAPQLIDAAWDGELLILSLDRPVTTAWVQALHHMGNSASVLGKSPHAFAFNGITAVVGAAEHEVQALIDNFKICLPMATRALKQRMETAAREHLARQQEQLRRRREAEQIRLRINRNIRL